MPRSPKETMLIVTVVSFVITFMWFSFMTFLVKHHSHLMEQNKSPVHQIYKETTNNVIHKQVWSSCADEYLLDQSFRIAVDGKLQENGCFCPCKSKKVVFTPLRFLKKKLMNNECFYIAYDDQFVVCHNQWYFEIRKAPINTRGNAGTTYRMDLHALSKKNNYFCLCKCDGAEKNKNGKPKTQHTLSSCLTIGKTSYVCSESKIYDVYIMADDIEHNQICTDIIPQAVWKVVLAIHQKRLNSPDYDDVTTIKNDKDQSKITGHAKIHTNLPTDMDESYYIDENDEPLQKRSVNESFKTELDKKPINKSIPKWVAKHTRIYWKEDNVNELAKIGSMIQLRMTVIDNMIRLKKNKNKSSVKQPGYKKGTVISSLILPIVITDVCKFKTLVNQAVAKLGKGGATGPSRDRIRFVVLGLSKSPGYTVSEMSKKSTRSPKVVSSHNSSHAPKWLRKTFHGYWKPKARNLVHLQKMWSELVIKLAAILNNLKKCKTT